jgi:hypothetical protein
LESAIDAGVAKAEADEDEPADTIEALEGNSMKLLPVSKAEAEAAAPPSSFVANTNIRRTNTPSVPNMALNSRLAALGVPGFAREPTRGVRRVNAAEARDAAPPSSFVPNPRTVAARGRA